MEEQKREKASNSQKDKSSTILFIKNIICDIIYMLIVNPRQLSKGKQWQQKTLMLES